MSTIMFPINEGNMGHFQMAHITLIDLKKD